jgi:titin
LKQNFGEYDYNGTRITSLEGDAKSFVITGYGKVRIGAVPGPNITCQLQAFDSIGNRSSANVPQGPQIWRTPPGLPSAPIDLNFEMDSRSSGVLSWLDPLNVGSPSFTHYVLQTSTDGTTWSTPMKRSLEAKSVSVDRLAANTDYWFRLRGENAGTVGQDTTYMNLNWSTVKIRTPAPVVADSPTSLVVSNITSTGYKLAWSAPSSNGGAAITDFKVEVSSDGGNTWRLAKQSASTSLTLSVSGAAPGTNYLVRVGAINSVGISDYLTGSLKTASTVPRTPRDVSSSNVSGTSLTLSWLLPSSNGGSAITDYKVEVSSNCASYTVINRPVSVNLGFNVTGLKPGTKYCFRVSAGNSIGYSSPTQVFEVSTQGYPPAAPTSLSVKASKTSVTLGWKAAVVNGGSAVKNYIVEYSKNNGYTWIKVKKPISTSRTLVITGLKNMNTYLFRVTAVNDAGSSAASKQLKVMTLYSRRG